MKTSKTTLIDGIQRADPVGYISPNLFGAINTNIFGFNIFTEHSKDIGLTDVRFPGGTVAEYGYVTNGLIRLAEGEINIHSLSGNRSNIAFDLTHPELISPVALEYDAANNPARNDVASFSQILSLAHERGVPVGLIIPVERYFNGIDFSDKSTRELAISTAKSDVSIFLDRLNNGKFNDGTYPSLITLEIGNENYTNPIEYAIVAKAIINQITTSMMGSSVNYEIAIHAGRGQSDFNTLKGQEYFEKFADVPPGEVDGLDKALSIVGSASTRSDRMIAIDSMKSHIIGDSLVYVDAIRHHILSYNSEKSESELSPLNERQQVVEFWMNRFEALGISRENVDYYVSAWSVGNTGSDQPPYQLAYASDVLGLFSHFAQHGVDRAAAWGLVGAFRYSDTMSGTVISDRLSEFASPQAAILKLMSENIAESEFLGTARDSEGRWVKYTYESEDSYTVFISAGNLEGSDLTVSVNMGFLADADVVSIANLDIADGAPNGQSRVTTVTALPEDGIIDVTFDQSYEVAMIKIDKSDSPSFVFLTEVEKFIGRKLSVDSESMILPQSVEKSPVSGSKFTDVIKIGDQGGVVGGGGDRGTVTLDQIDPQTIGRIGDNRGDILIGGAGNDTMYGSSGNDLLGGGYGDDNLWGGAGFDTFIFVGGKDTIHDFNPVVDRVLVDKALLYGRNFDEWFESSVVTNEKGIQINFSSDASLSLYDVFDENVVLSNLELVDTFSFW
ncbi:MULTISPECIES: hypothetical protein [unclassified Yoonia]|uniref:hypothetical protein n=1 Tax=unclassified Yoonia TaxID=2629118 RepID=UPI002AFEB52C|nr:MULTISPECIES: hypothetical protein [unclassified Yoonia]